MPDSDLALAADRIAGSLGEYEAAMLATLEKLVRTNSHASNRAGVNAVAELMVQQLSLLGLTCEAVVPPPVPASQEWLAPVIFPEAGYDEIADVVVARREGDPSAGRVLLLGDLDTSYTQETGGAPAAFAFRVDGARAFGPGIADMKGGLVTLLGALRALQDAELAAPALTIVLSPDEQAGSLRSRPVIEGLARECDLCFSLECARDGGKLMHSRAAIGVGLLEVFGVEAHAGSARDAGVSAVRALAELIPAVEDLTNPAAGDYVTVGLMRGGRRRSVVPGYASCVLDVRAKTTVGWQALNARISEAVERVPPPATTRWRGANHRPALEQTTASRALLDRVRRAGELLGIAVEATGSSAGGSCSFAAELDLPTIDGMGPSGSHLMTDRECIEVPTMRERAALLALSLHLLAREGTAV